MTQIDRLVKVAHRLGFRVLQGSDTVAVSGDAFRTATVECRDNGDAVRFLNELAKDDAVFDTEVRDLGRAMRASADRKGLSAIDLAKELQDFVRTHVAFAEEQGERFRLPSLTLRLGAGDCDDSARLLASLAIAAGVPARILLVNNSKGEGSHVAAQLWAADRWWWSETTFPADLGEDPREGAVRLGLVRSDVA